MTIVLAQDEAGIARAAKILAAGGLVAFGTETVYGLGGDATNPQAVAGIFAAKGRPRFNPLIAHYADADQAFTDVKASRQAVALAAALWPGPLTMVLPRRNDCRVALLASAGLDTQAVRVPANRTARDLLRCFGKPLAGPSANPSGQVSPTTAAHVLEGLGGRIDAVLDSGPCPVGVESTVLDLSADRPRLLRPGGATIEAIEAVIGLVDRNAGDACGDGELRSPGMMVSHYAPRLPVRLDAVAVAPDEALLAFGEPLPGGGAMFQLSRAGDPVEAAAALFGGLRWLDAQGLRLGLARIAVMPIPEAGLGLAINDRLRRAAAPRG